MYLFHGHVLQAALLERQVNLLKTALAVKSRPLEAQALDLIVLNNQLAMSVYTKKR
jgi:hypothetical protein